MISRLISPVEEKADADSRVMAKYCSSSVEDIGVGADLLWTVRVRCGSLGDTTARKCGSKAE